MMMAVLSLVMLSSCDRDDFYDDDPRCEWDASPIYFRFLLEDEEGNNLLDRDYKGNWLDKPIEIRMKKKTYEMTIVEPRDTRYVPARWYGLYVIKNKRGDALLYFGEFDRAYDRDDTEFVIDWGDGTTDKVMFNNRVKYKFGVPTITTNSYFNGDKFDDYDVVRVVKQSHSTSAQ